MSIELAQIWFWEVKKMVVILKGESYTDLNEKKDCQILNNDFQCLSDNNCDCVTSDYNCPNDT